MLPWEQEPAELLVTFKILVIQVLNCPGMHGLHYLEQGAVVRQASCSEYHHVCWAHLAFPWEPPQDWEHVTSRRWKTEGGGSPAFSADWKEKALGDVMDVLNSPATNRTIVKSELILAITLLKGLRKVLPRQELWPLGIYIKSGHPIL